MDSKNLNSNPKGKSALGFIVQTQRQAIEALKQLNKIPAFDVPLNVKAKFKLTDDRELYLLGISKGMGTRSEAWGVNVAVFGSSPPAEKIKGLAGEQVKCEYAVLLRLADFGERITAGFQPKGAQCYCVELLGYVGRDKDNLVFRLTGITRIYVSM